VTPLIQLEYIGAVDTWRHVATAVVKCSITQLTLSMQLQKIEAELGVQIFDRSKVPVMPTAEGVEIIQIEDSTTLQIACAGPRSESSDTPQLGEKRILDALQREILLAVPQDMQHKGSRTVVES
jgi:DNA-binding transcriptional LysR family regulator